ncbi:MAG: hypothetical protein SGILL_002102, partial [Bacillariaceae sp.]
NPFRSTESVPVSVVECKSTTSLAGTNMEPSMELVLEKKLAIETLDYFCLDEESKLQKNIFIADFDGPDDWNDHFLKRKKAPKKKAASKGSKSTGAAKKEASVDTSNKDKVETTKDSKEGDESAKVEKNYDSVVGIQLTSYEARSILQKQQILHEPGRDLSELPLQINNDDAFNLSDMKDLEEAIALIDAQVLAQASQGCEDIRSHVFDASMHFLYNETKMRQKALFDIKHNKNFQNAEVLLGFCHVRSRIKQGKIINGPLFEIEMNVSIGSEAIFVRPLNAAKVRLNTEVMNNLGVNATVRTELSELAAKIDVFEIKLGDSTTYKELLEESKKLNYAVRLVSTDDESAHEILEDKDSIHLVGDAWCLYTRQPTTTATSRDCRATADAIRDGGLELTVPAQAFLNDPSWLEDWFGREDRTEIPESALHYPLKSTADQKEIGRLALCKRAPVFTVHGPPGVGKTQTAVNIGCAYLSMNVDSDETTKTNVVFTSMNEQALSAFQNMLPSEIRPFCVGMPLSYEESGLHDLKHRIEDLIEATRNAKADVKKHLTAAEGFSKEIEEKKESLKAIDKRVSDFRIEQNKLADDPEGFGFLLLALKLGNGTAGLARAALGLDKTVLDALCKEARREVDPDVSFEVFNPSRIEEYVKFAQEEASTGFCFRTQEMDLFTAGIKVGNTRPNTKEDWGLVASELDRRKNDTTAKYHEAISKLGCVEADISYQDGSFKNEFILDLQGASIKLREKFESLSKQSQTTISRLLVGFDCTVEEQKQKILLNEKIQSLEALLNKERILSRLGQTINDNNLGNLNDFCQLIGSLNDSALADNTERLKVNKAYSQIKAKFQEIAKFLPFSVMTHDQLRDMVAPKDTIGLILVDEASQSEFTTASRKFVARHVSPSVAKNDWTTEVNALAPRVPSRFQLQNGRSVFDVFKVAFPSKQVNMFMREHFRSDPRITRVFNEIFYNSKLQPMRSPGREDALVDVFVDVGSKPKRGEAFGLMRDRLKEILQAHVEHCQQTSSIHTLGIIVFGNTKEARTEVAKCKEKLVEQYGIKAVEAHNIIVGTPMAFQGDERDVMILLDSEIGKCQQDAESKKKWNVALSRGKEKIYLVRSYPKKKLGGYDIRQEILRYFTESVGSTSLNTDSVSNGNALVLRERTQTLLVTALQQKGFLVANNNSNTWTKALLVAPKDGSENNALIHVDNAGESDDTWERMVQQQHSLVGANRNCLRVPMVSLALDFQTTLACIFSFLKNAGLEVDISRSRAIALSADGVQSNKKRPPSDPMPLNPSKRAATGETTPSISTTSAKRSSPSLSDNTIAVDNAKRLKSLNQSSNVTSLEVLDDRKKRARVYYSSLHFKAHSNDLKIELRSRGMECLSKVSFGERKRRLQENEGNEESFEPRSEAKFAPKA